MVALFKSLNKLKPQKYFWLLFFLPSFAKADEVTLEFIGLSLTGKMTYIPMILLAFFLLIGVFMIGNAFSRLGRQKKDNTVNPRVEYVRLFSGLLLVILPTAIALMGGVLWTDSNGKITTKEMLEQQRSTIYNVNNCLKNKNNCTPY